MYAKSYLTGICVNQKQAQKDLESMDIRIKEIDKLVENHEHVIKFEELLNKDFTIKDSSVRKLFKERGISQTIKKGTGASLISEDDKKLIFERERIRFNAGSTKNLRELFIDMLGMPVLSVTDSGLPQVSRKNLKEYGELGLLLAERSQLMKDEKEVEKLLDGSKEDGRIHPFLRSGSTISGRTSSSRG